MSCSPRQRDTIVLTVQSPDHPRAVRATHMRRGGPRRREDGHPSGDCLIRAKPKQSRAGSTAFPIARRHHLRTRDSPAKAG
jgi:hypothetical protein